MNETVPSLTTRSAAGAALLELQHQRLPAALQRAEAKVRAIVGDDTPGRHVRAAQGARTVRQRVVWMHRAASAWAAQLEGLAACRRGCSHCCRMPVAITRTEAELLANASGRLIAYGVATARPFTGAGGIDLEAIESASQQLERWPVGSACPFLRNGECSVYDARPVACRVLLNLDDDDLLCRHSSAGAAMVPYADSRQLRALAFAAQPNLELADIRDFFPPKF